MNGWARWMRHSIGMSEKTVKRRLSTMGRFVEHCHPADLTAATVELIEDFLQQHPNPSTRRAYLSDLASFYRFARKRGLVDTDPTIDVDRPKEPKRLPRPMPEQVAAAALTEATDTRVRLALALAVYAGLRRSEICALSGEDIDLEGTIPTLVVRGGKGGRDRTVPVHPQLRAELAAFAPRTGPVVRTVDGRRLSESRLGQLVRGHMDGIGSGHRLHTGRHRFGTQAASATGGDLQVVAELLGHSSLATTRGYTQLSGARTAAAVAAMPGVA